jgi:hypothetical protein
MVCGMHRVRPQQFRLTPDSFARSFRFSQLLNRQLIPQRRRENFPLLHSHSFRIKPSVMQDGIEPISPRIRKPQTIV